MGILGVGAGAAGGLEDLLARNLAQDKFDEEKRVNTSNEDYRNKALNESTAIRKQTADDTRQERLRQDQDRNENRVTRTVGFRPIGSTVTPKERENEVAAGVPEALYKEQPPQVASAGVAGGATAPSLAKGSGTAFGVKKISNAAAPGRIEFTGTEAERSGEGKIADAERRAAQANEDRDAARGIAQHREDRLQSYGAPTVVIQDTGGTGARVVGRDHLPAGGAEAPGTGAQRAGVSDAQTAVDTLDRITKNYSDDMVGPIQGRVNAAQNTIPFVPVNKQFASFSADSATLRNAIIRAITGAQMSQPEAERIMSQIPSETDKPDVWNAKAASTRANLQNILAHKGGTSDAGGGTATPAASGTGNIKSIRVKSSAPATK